mgnify:CR=1 FL=1
MNFDDIQSEKNYKPFKVYSYSKLANILFTRKLSEILKFGIEYIGRYKQKGRTLIDIDVEDILPVTIKVFLIPSSNTQLILDKSVIIDIADVKLLDISGYIYSNWI